MSALDRVNVRTHVSKDRICIEAEVVRDEPDRQRLVARIRELERLSEPVPETKEQS